MNVSFYTSQIGQNWKSNHLPPRWLQIIKCIAIIISFVFFSLQSSEIDTIHWKWCFCELLSNLFIVWTRICERSFNADAYHPCKLQQTNKYHCLSVDSMHMWRSINLFKFCWTIPRGFVLNCKLCSYGRCIQEAHH